MPTTPVYALPYPAATDPADVPADIKRLADRVELVLAPAYVTTLPGSPVDGQEVYYLASVGGQTALWHLRYRAAATGTFKWECIGGQALFIPQASNPSNGATLNNWVNLVPAPLALPLAGEYEAGASGTLKAGASACTMLTSMYLGAATAATGMSTSTTVPGAGYNAAFAVPTQRITATAGQALGVSGSANIANCEWSNLALRVLPLRVS